MSRVRHRSSGRICAVVVLAFLATATARAVEPTGPIHLFARAASLEEVGTFRGQPVRALAVLEVRVLRGADLEGFELRVLDPRREPVEGVAIEGEGILRRLFVPLIGEGVHELILQGVAGDERDEVAIRVPLGVPGFAPDDDGEVASFPLEVRP